MKRLAAHGELELTRAFVEQFRPSRLKKSQLFLNIFLIFFAVARTSHRYFLYFSDIFIVTDNLIPLLRKKVTDIFPVSSSSKSLNAFASSSCGSRSSIHSVTE